MAALFRFLPQLLSIVTSLLDFFRAAKAKEDARKEVGAAIAVKEAETAREAAIIIAQSRTDADTSTRMREGSF